MPLRWSPIVEYIEIHCGAQIVDLDEFSLSKSEEIPRNRAIYRAHRTHGDHIQWILFILDSVHMVFREHIEHMRLLRFVSGNHSVGITNLLALWTDAISGLFVKQAPPPQSAPQSAPLSAPKSFHPFRMLVGHPRTSGSRGLLWRRICGHFSEFHGILVHFWALRCKVLSLRQSS